MAISERGAARAPIIAGRGVVSSGHPLAASAALQQLMSGGNAVDAALAASAVQCVVEMPWCGLGGDLFLMVYTPETEVQTLNGAGRAPARIEDAIGEGEKVPRYGALSIAVPGLPLAWDRACRRFASKRRQELLDSAIDYAGRGFPMDVRLANAMRRLATSRDVSPALSRLITEARPEPGRIFRQPDLATSLEIFAGAGCDAIYRGRIGEQITSAVAARDGVLAQSDLAEHLDDWIEPIEIGYRGATVYEQPLPSLGCLLLAELCILEGFDVSAMRPGSPELIDLLVRCKEAAFSDSVRLGDPVFGGDRAAEMLSAERIGFWREQIARQRIEPVTAALPGGADTTSTVVADGEGGVACLIQSHFNEFGSRELVEGTGILLNDRLANMTRDAASPNGLRGRKRPLHTLNSYIVCRDGVPVLAGATPGGRGQVQINLQIISDVVDFGMDVQQAVDAPRWISGGAYRGLTEDALYVEPALDGKTISGLRALGRTVEATAATEPDLFGNVTVVARDPTNGALLGAADGRRSGAAAGW